MYHLKLCGMIFFVTGQQKTYLTFFKHTTSNLKRWALVENNDYHFCYTAPVNVLYWQDALYHFVKDLISNGMTSAVDPKVGLKSCNTMTRRQQME